MNMRRILLSSLTAFTLFSCSPSSENKSETSQNDFPEEVKKLMSEMSVEEKVGQMAILNLTVLTTKDSVTGKTTLDKKKLEDVLMKHQVGNILNTYAAALSQEEWRSIVTEIQDYALKTPHKIPVLYGVDAIHGATYHKEAVLFPQNIALAATRNPELARLGAKATAADIRAAGIRWNYAPVLDVARQPLWARFGETYGEDPTLVGAMGCAAIKGYEEDGIDKKTGVASCMKHYLGYSAPVTGKDRTPSIIPETQLREIFLPPFEAAVKAGSSTIMINSGEINGVPVHGSKWLLTDILRGELGFKGVAVTDWLDIKRLHGRHRIAKDEREAVKIGINAGIDMSMVPFELDFCTHLIDLVKAGEVPMERIDEAVGRILTLKVKLGLFKNAYPEKEAIAQFNNPKNKELALDAARQAMTLLKNDGGILPLKKGTKILLAGPGADKVSFLNGCWSFSWQGNEENQYPEYYTTIAEDLEAYAAKGSLLNYNSSLFFKEALKAKDPSKLLSSAVSKTVPDVIVLCLGEDAYAETPGSIRELELAQEQQDLVKAAYATGKPVIIVLTEGRPRIIREIEPLAKGILMAYWPGSMGGKAIAETLFGLNNPTGKLPFTYPKYSGNIVTYDLKYSDVEEDLGLGNTDTGYDVQWGFGHGLSYTTFEYSALNCDTVLKGDGSIKVSVTIKNTGAIDGTEVVDLFTRDHFASITPSMKRLRAFQRIALKAGESKTITFSISAADVSFINQQNKRVTEEGKFDVLVGNLKKEFSYQQ